VRVALRRTASLIAVALACASVALAGGGYGRLLAQSKPSPSDRTSGAIQLTQLPASVRVFTVVFSGPAGQMTMDFYVGCVNGEALWVRTIVTKRPYVRSFRPSRTSGACRASGGANITQTNPDGSLKIIPATIRLYGR
jgi:hypothetical protein